MSEIWGAVQNESLDSVVLDIYQPWLEAVAEPDGSDITPQPSSSSMQAACSVEHHDHDHDHDHGHHHKNGDSSIVHSPCCDHAAAGGPPSTQLPTAVDGQPHHDHEHGQPHHDHEHGHAHYSRSDDHSRDCEAAVAVRDLHEHGEHANKRIKTDTHSSTSAGIVAVFVLVT